MENGDKELNEIILLILLMRIGEHAKSRRMDDGLTKQEPTSKQPKAA
ncbi:MAG: hypothetical protein AOA65_1975 [Candidatus Bathyarchaeota archaeon BA1]|nr:MAG: hypothetical protein AOA65_1975 [Candidatus Bathyarchaeota archaeon BA1]